ncbi:hypothetical protein [Nonomuraea sp. SYSU D8015]|uniref:hypothetical protein n=1 Tax=Nonomuraea sp. SYSU D8015 TaxID=2593644 RepID=UPI001660BABD|nr:hypothetical protein [Nonomuraea sp. SYSU D8015]
MSSREPFDELEAELLALGDLLDVPTPPPSDVAAAVRARLESTPDAAPAPGGEGAGAGEEAAGEPQDPGGGPDPAHGPPATPIRPHSRRPRRGEDRRRPPGRRRRWKVVTAVVIVVIAITAATPQGRAAVARILRFAGIELEIGAAPPPPVTTTAPLPGERTVPPSEVPSRAGFQVRTPSRLGPPQRTSVADGGRLVSIFWPDGIRLDQFEGTMDPYFFKKAGPPFPDFVKVGPYQALWLPGEHPLGYIKRVDGSVVPLRQAAATLIWQQNGITYRLEGVRTKEEAIRIAESLE